ncbi:hypothetical protein EON65_11830 [archaeon]|nr:MAG: hypothetical protein EON65_11830 [archaeon]
MFQQDLRSIDLTDLSRGEGDWRNMQDVVRRTFRICLENQQKQADKIAQLSHQVTKLQEDCHRKPSWEDVERLVETRLLANSHRKSVATGSPPLDEIRLELSQVRASLDHKVNTRTLDCLLAKKVDKADILLRNLTESNSSALQSDLVKLKSEVLDITSRLDLVESEMDKDSKTVDLPQLSRDMVLLRAQVENIYKSFHDYYNKDHLKHLLEQKVSHNELPSLLAAKASDDAVQRALQSVEETLARHEKQLTSLRLRLVSCYLVLLCVIVH